MRRHVPGEVPGGRTAEHREPELHGLGGRHRHHAVLYEKVGWFTESSFTQTSATPSSCARRSARTSGVKPELNPVFGVSTGSSSR